MPPIASEKQVLDELSKLVSPSVVAIIRYRQLDSIGFGTGFIIFSDCNKVLVCAHKVVLRDAESVSVRFQDETEQDASVLMRNTKSNHVILQVAADSCPRQSVSFSECPITRENIFTIAAVERKGKLGLMSGTISIPNCRAVRPNGVHASESENLFAMSCPAAGPQKLGELKGEELELTGAAVFDMNGLVIGTVEWVDARSYDIKFAVKASCFLNSLEHLLKAIDEKIYLSKGQGGFAQGASTSSQGGSTSGSESRKRGREDSLGGGTGSEKSLCLDHIEVNADVVSEEKMKLNMYPIHGNMEVARREAMRLELVRLVTRKSSEHLRGSASSPDAGIEANQCMNVFIARNPDEVGSENGISVEPFDLNHFFGEDGGKIYGYKNLKIKVWISAISFHAYADISFVETSDRGKGITDLKPALRDMFGENLVEKEEFLHTFSNECQYISDVVKNGCVIKHAVSDDRDSAIEIVRVELQGAAMVLYSRLVPLVLLLVEGSTTIDMKEHGWEMLLVVEKETHESSTKTSQLLGFTVARCCRESAHLQIGQVLFLPSYQGECHSNHLIEAIGSIAISENIHRVTIERPPDCLQHIHSSIDCLRLLTFDPIKPVLSAMVLSLKETKLSERTTHGLRMVPPTDLAEAVRLNMKMSMKQFLACMEILMYLNLDAEDREDMDKLRACIYYRLKGEMLGRATGEQVTSSSTSLCEGTSFLVACSTKEEQRADDATARTQEEELNEMVEKRLEEIAKVARNLVSRGQG